LFYFGFWQNIYIRNRNLNPHLDSIIKYSEVELVSLLRRQDRNAFSYLYDNYAPALNGVIYKMVEDSQLAEDILQEVFVKIWNNFESYDSKKGRLFTWMVQITRNLTIDHLRSKGYGKQQKISSTENFVSTLTDKGEAALKLDTIGLSNQVLKLKPEYRSLIELAYFQGLTQDEIAQQTGIALGTVKTRLRSAIIELRKHLQNE
jgi:RNA polymerase sigma-70 factor (ECF subfamily)